MKFYYLTMFIILITSCRYNNTTKKNSFENLETIDNKSNDSLQIVVDQIYKIKNIPYSNVHYSSSFHIDSTYENCGDSIYWYIVSMGKEIVPFLITKILDTTESNIVIQCSNEKLKYGTVAFIILDNIIQVPYAITFNTQFCVMDRNCNNNYIHGVLQLVNNNSKRAHSDILKWYLKYNKKFIKNRIINKTKCQIENKILFKWDYEYY